MLSSLIITFSGASPELQAYFFPEIILDDDSNYSCALLDLIICDIVNVDDIGKLELVRINCDIISDSYINGESSHALYQFATCTSLVKNKTFVEIPKNISYLPVKTKNLRSILISIVDRYGKLVNISSGHIICRINIKRDHN